jgi:nickel transport protein
MNKSRIICAAFVAAGLLVAFSRPGLAHRVNLFAYVEGDTVHVECSYKRSERVRYGEIIVRNPTTGAIYLTGKTDENGNFVFPVPTEARAAKTDLGILLRAGEGHQNDWIVKAGEYLSALPAAAAPTVGPAAAPKTTVPAASEPVDPAVSAQSPSAVPAGPAPAVLTTTAMQAVVEAAVEKKIAPLRKMLLEDKEKGPSLSEIVGGIGYLVGLAGLAAYIRSRKGGVGS